jgi:DMSO/TMAO reductase YedYZ molybdopterin-dependent catalytic subunit
MKFFEKNRAKLAQLGIDASRLPPGQYFTERFPVLDLGDRPADTDPASWTLKLFGMVHHPVTLSWSELQALPAVEITTDIHCVTKWSKFDTRWKGVRFRDLVALADVDPQAHYVVEHAFGGYTTNVPLTDTLADDVLVAWEYGGAPLAPEHGGPLRMVLPKLYFWKSAKWLTGLEFVPTDEPGFWERNGYHMYGDPFLEQRFSHQ